MTKDELDTLLDRDKTLNEQDYSNVQDWISSNCYGFSEDEWNAYFDKLLNRFEKENNKICTDLIKKYVKEFHNTCPRKFVLYLKMIEACAYVCLKSKDEDCFVKYVQEYMYNAIAQITPNAINHNMDYYSFRGVTDYSIKEIVDEEISFAHPRSFNDPLDTLFNWWIEEEIKHLDQKDIHEQEFILLLKKMSEHIKMRCLIGTVKKDNGNNVDVEVDDLPVLMWSHYANSHKGMCIRYHFKENFFKDYSIGNSKELLFIIPAKYSDAIKVERKEKDFMANALLLKSKDWEYENEKRMIFYSQNLADGEKVPNEFPTIKCEGAIKSIYLGVRCSDADRRKVEKAIGDKNIRLYKMVIDSDKPTRLKAKRIG